MGNEDLYYLKYIKDELHDLNHGIKNITEQIKCMTDAVALLNNNFVLDESEEDYEEQN